MKKNIYSLALSEDVIKAIDVLATRKGSNRSALVNEILAEYVSYVTPEMRRKQIFSAVLGILENESLLLGNPAENLLNIRSSISFKYHPGIKYSVELYPGGEALGLFKASIRTQNPDLLRLYYDFCQTFTALEERYIGKTKYRAENGCYIRELSLRSNDSLSGLLSAEDLGGLIAEYVKTFDTAVKGYFEHCGNREYILRVMRDTYETYLRSADEIL